MNVIIVGCTQVGVSLAADLCKMGHDVAVIDRDADNFSDLPAFFKGLTVEGVAMDVSVLEKAGILECDAFAAVTDDDNLNIVAAQLAREKYKIENVVVRIVDPVRERVYQNLGLKSVCPTNIEAASLFNMVTGEVFDSLVSFGNRKAHFITRHSADWEGKLLCDIPVFPGEIVYAVVDTEGEVCLAEDRARVLGAGEKVVFSRLAD